MWPRRSRSCSASRAASRSTTACSYSDDALKAAAELAARHINERHLPDKAIDVVDEAGARLRLKPIGERESTVEVRHIEDVVARMARIPAKSVSTSDREVLKNLERNLKLVDLRAGQGDRSAGRLPSRWRARAWATSANRWAASCSPAPPAWARRRSPASSRIAMGVEFLRFDMSEYMERHTVSRLIGAPPGYVGFDQGGLLTEAITKHPHCVLLLDEIEKAHPDVFNLLLQVMDHGTLTDNNGRKADFRHVIIVMTTNAGAQEMARPSIGFTQADNASDGMEAIRRIFTPEFRNRLDAVIQFAALDPVTIERVVDKLLVEVEMQLEAEGRARSRWMTPPAAGSRRRATTRRWARGPMARTIQEHIKRPLAEELLFGKPRRRRPRCACRWRRTARSSIWLHTDRSPKHSRRLDGTQNGPADGLDSAEPASSALARNDGVAARSGPPSAAAIDDAALGQVVRRHFHGDGVACEDADVVLAHLARRYGR